MTGSTFMLEMLSWFQLMALIVGIAAVFIYLGERNSQIDQNAQAIAKLASSVEDLVRAQATMNTSLASSQRAIEDVVRRLDDMVRRIDAREDSSERSKRRQYDKRHVAPSDAEVR